MKNETTTQGATAMTNTNGAAPAKLGTRKVQGFGYRYGNELFVSVNPVIGGWPMELEIDEDIELVPVTKFDTVVNGERVKLTDLVKDGKVKPVGTIEEALERFKVERKANSEQAKVARAQEQAKKAAEKAEAMKLAAEKRAAEAAQKAKELAERAKNAGKPAVKKEGGKATVAA